MLRHVFILSLLLLGPRVAWGQETDIFAAAKAIGKGLNLGNALEAPKEGDWGVTLKAEYFVAIKEAGFQSVRLPVKWSAHAAKDAPYKIDDTFFGRIDWAIEQAIKNKLVIIVNAHHYDEIYQEPEAHQDRLAALWEQIATRYQKQSPSVYFELLNEPNSKLSDEKWNDMAAKLLAIVRKTNPTRPVVIGPSFWNSIHGLEKMKLPAADRQVIATFHYYLPFEFTHQGAPWHNGAERWKGRKWGTEQERMTLAEDFAKAKAWAEREKRPLLLGEFGVYQAADMSERAKWTRAVVREAEKNGFPWTYWEFCSGFGAYDPMKNAWRTELRDALLKP